MMKFYSLLAFIAISSWSVQAQTKVSLGKPYAVIDANEKYYFSRNNEILTVKIEKKNVILQKMNAADLTFQKIKLYDDFPRDKDCRFEEVTAFGDHYYLFYSHWLDDKERLFCREIDFATGSFKGPGRELFSVNEKIVDAPAKPRIWNEPSDGKYSFFFSYGSKRMVVQYRLKPEKRNDSKSHDIIGVHVFDENMDMQWGNKIEMPHTEKQMDNLDYTVDSKGNVYLATRVYKDDSTDEKKGGEKEANFDIEIIKIAAGSTSTAITKVSVDDKLVKSVWLYETAKGDMIGAGFYSKEKYVDAADGVFIFKLSTDGKLYDKKSVEIPLEILNQYVNNKTRRKNERKDDDDRAEMSSLILRQVIVQNDESVVLLGEQRFIVEHYSYNSNQASGSSYTSFHSNNILVTKISGDGKLAWMRKLPKRQTGLAGFYSISYKYFSGGSDHYFLFLDNEKNVNLPITEVPEMQANGKGGFLTAFKINDSTGEVIRTSLLDTRDVKGMEIYQFSPQRITTTAPYTFVFEAYKKNKEDILIKVEMDQ